MKRHFLICSLSVSALTAAGLGTAHAAEFTFLTSPSLVGYVTFDEFLGNGDDQVFADINTFGGASQFLDSLGTFGFLGGTTQIQGLTALGPQPRPIFGTNEHTSLSMFGEWNSNVLQSFNNPFTQILDAGASSIITINQDQTYTTSFVLNDDAVGGRVAFTGSGR